MPTPLEKEALIQKIGDPRFTSTPEILKPLSEFARKNKENQDSLQPSVVEDEDDYMLNVINNADYRMAPG